MAKTTAPAQMFASVRSIRQFLKPEDDGWPLKSDGKTPADYAYNVDVTRTVVNFAHACGVSVEGEIGCLGSLETGWQR